MSYCKLTQTGPDQWTCSVCGTVHRFHCKAKCQPERVDRLAAAAARCRACPHVLRETPFAISCQVLDGEISCPRERIGRHQRRLLDPLWNCQTKKES